MKPYRTTFLSQRGGQRSRWLVFALLGMLFRPAHAHASLFKGEALDKVADVMTWVVLVIAPIIVITVFWLVHILPEKIAEKKQHPQAKAIQTLRLLSLFFRGMLWPIAWLRAYSKPVNSIVSASLALLTAGLMLITFGCKKAAPPAPPPPVVQVMNIAGTNAAMDTEIIGQLDSPQNVEVRARVEAFVEKVLFTEGTEVKEGAPLFELDRKPFQQRLNAANGMLAEAKAALGKYQADTNRLAPLARLKAIPQQDLDNSVASVAVGAASVQSAEARVESAKLDLTYCDVRAPISGLIGAKMVSIGDFVGKGEPTLLATISKLDPIWFYCAISEAQYLKAENEVRRTGKKVAEVPVSLILANGAVHPAKGKFVFIDRAVDTKTGTLRVRAEFANAEKLLRPGMFGRIKIDLGVRPDSILVPERAVAELQGKTFVWVVGSDNKTTQRAVKVGEPVGGGVLILEGLKAGDRIVVEGLQKVREGAVVQPMTVGEIQAAAQSAPQAEAKPAKE